MASLANLPIPSLKCLQFRHDCQHLGCANQNCPQCALCQRRRCVGNFAPKYLAPCDVLEAKCGAQIYVVIVDAATGALVQGGLDDSFLQLSIVDGRKLASEGEWEEALDRCQLLVNKAGQPLLAHGRSGAYSEENAVMVPLIAGQAMLPDLKVTDSSEALLTGRAPPFRLLARVVQRGGLPLPGVAPVLSEPFVVATARVKGAAKAEIPHVDDNVGKLEGLGVQTQKKLEDIAAAATAAGVPNLQVPLNCVTKVGQFKELVEIAERSKPLRETLKQVLRLTKGWDVARDHARRAVHTDVQLRVFHPDGRTDVGLVYRCGAFNVVDINQPVGLLRRRRAEQRVDQELVDVIWLESDVNAWPDAVRRIVPRAASAWWHEAHPGWAFLPLTVTHIPQYAPNGKPIAAMSSYSFTLKTSPPVSGNGPAGMPGGQGGVSVAGMPGSSNNMTLGTGMVPQMSPSGGMGDMNFPGAVPTSALLPPIPPPVRMEENGGGPGPTGGGGGGGGQANNPPAPNSGGASGMFSLGSGFPAIPSELLASLGMSGGGGGVFGPLSGGSDGLPNLAAVAGGQGGENSLSPFEDPAFQNLMQMVAANNDSGRGPAPRSGESDGGSKGKRKADASLDTWMAMHKSLDLDLDLPSNLGMDSLPVSGSGGSGAGPRTVVGSLLPVVGVNSLEIQIPGLLPPPQGNNNTNNANNSGAGTSVPFTEFLAAVQQQRAQQRAQLEHRTSLGSGGGPPRQMPRPNPPHSTDSAPASGHLPDNAPARMPAEITMGDLRAMFGRAARQEIPYQALEDFLRRHGLVSDSSANRSGNAEALQGHGRGPAPGSGGHARGPPPGSGGGGSGDGPRSGGHMQHHQLMGFPPGLDQSGLDDMRSMEDELPPYR